MKKRKTASLSPGEPFSCCWAVSQLGGLLLCLHSLPWFKKYLLSVYLTSIISSFLSADPSSNSILDLRCSIFWKTDVLSVNTGIPSTEERRKTGMTYIFLYKLIEKNINKYFRGK